MQNKSQVAIMMPVYNGEKTLPLAVSSLLHQTYTNWKCYIVNDGSTDGTKAYLDSLKDERFVIIHFEKNKGRPHARQAALDIAEGHYLAFLDADDFYHPEKLEKQVEALNRNKEIYLVGCGMGSFDKKLILRIVRSKHFTIYEKFKRGKELFKLSRAGSMVYLLEAKKIGYNLKLKYAQDTDFFLRYLDGKSYMNLDSLLYYYSEFESVTFKKLIKTYYYNIIQLTTNYSGFTRIKYVVLEITKVIYTLILSMFFGMEKVLLRRGKKGSIEHIEEFNEILKIYN